MKLLLVAQTYQGRTLFEKSWDVLRKKFDMTFSSINSVYIAESENLSLSEKFPLELLRKYKKNIGKPMFDFVVIIGNLNNKDAQYLTLLLHQGLIGSLECESSEPIPQVLVIDTNQPKESPFPQIKWSKYAKHLDDYKGVAMDLAEVLAKCTGVSFSLPDVREKFKYTYLERAS